MQAFRFGAERNLLHQSLLYCVYWATGARHVATHLQLSMQSSMQQVSGRAPLPWYGLKITDLNDLAFWCGTQPTLQVRVLRQGRVQLAQMYTFREEQRLTYSRSVLIFAGAYISEADALLRFHSRGPVITPRTAAEAADLKEQSRAVEAQEDRGIITDEEAF